MKLTSARVKNFKSVQDSTEFDIDDKITCLVGKNQAGKTALLEALNLQSDIDLTYTLEDEDRQIIKERFGDECLKDDTLTITFKNGNLNVGLNADNNAAVRYLIENTRLPKRQKDKLLGIQDTKALVKETEAHYNLLVQKEQTEDSQQEQINDLKQKLISDLNLLREELPSIITQNGLSNTIYKQILQPRTPKFLYTNEHYPIQGNINLTELNERRMNNTLENSDRALFTIIDNTTLNQILGHGTSSSIVTEAHLFRENVVHTLI